MDSETEGVMELVCVDQPLVIWLGLSSLKIKASYRHQGVLLAEGKRLNERGDIVHGALVCTYI